MNIFFKTNGKIFFTNPNIHKNPGYVTSATTRRLDQLEVSPAVGARTQQ